ncbi:hypothetical protein NP603_08770 [Methylomonas sp. SURF-1]|uniref:Kelch repeat-containing protein n=1 Tax=Methylomonas aurea TaxID=2952224 RepID=A0ABT1UG43_9GAMM|nr:hypothetical protein [Methylomonas sp. SURF-1]MCQ8181199.1 hypothetical protein [Methylomonas sp. SURF-1]
MWRKAVKYYFSFFSALFHLGIVLALGFYLTNKITHHWRWQVLVHAMKGRIDDSAVYPINSREQLAALPSRVWTKIDQQQPDAEARFERQPTATCAFDKKRNRLLVFGAEVNENPPDNAIHYFDLTKLRWENEYEADPLSSYFLDKSGFLVAGFNLNHPPAMQVFGAGAFDEKNDQLVIASSVKREFYETRLPNIPIHESVNPTWNYDFALKRWHAEANATDFRTYSVAYDEDRNVVVGFQPYHIGEWNGQTKSWQKVGNATYPAWNTNAVYDSVNRVFLLFGGSNLSNEVHSYQAGSQKSVKMPTPGIKPPGRASVPLVFHKGIGKMVAIIDQDNYAETWTYDYRKDEWQHLNDIKFPYNVGMNYCLEYDSRNNIMLFVSSPPMEQTAVWALRL